MLVILGVRELSSLVVVVAPTLPVRLVFNVIDVEVDFGSVEWGQDLEGDLTEVAELLREFEFLLLDREEVGVRGVLEEGLDWGSARGVPIGADLALLGTLTSPAVLVTQPKKSDFKSKNLTLDSGY